MEIRKSIWLLAVVGALAVMAVSAAAASAAPHWYSEGVRIPEGESVKVLTSSANLELIDEEAGAVLECSVIDAGTIVNPVGGGAGEDEITAFVNPECGLTGCPAGAAGTEAEGFNWHSQLFVDPAGEVRDLIAGIEITVFCGPFRVGHYAGSLSPQIEGSDAVFDESAGFLESDNGTPGIVNGADHIEGLAGEVITVQNP